MSEAAVDSFEVESTSGRFLRESVLRALPALPPRRRTEIEMAVAELAGHLIESGAGSARASITSDTRSVIVDVVSADETSGADVDPMRARILDFVADSWWVDGSDASSRSTPISQIASVVDSVARVLARRMSSRWRALHS